VKLRIAETRNGMRRLLPHAVFIGALIFSFPVQSTAQLSSSADARDCYTHASTLFAKHDFSAAEPLFQKAINLDPRFADAYKGLGLTEVELKKYNEAYRAWLKAADLNPQDGKVKYYLGRLFYEANLPNEAAAWLREALAASPHDFAAMTYLGLSAEALSYEDVALQLYRQAITESEQNHTPYSWAFLSLANLLQKRGSAEEALRVLQQGEQECPEAHELAALGRTLFARGETERAEQVLRRAINMDATVAEAHYRLGLLLQSSGRTEAARQEMDAFRKAKDLEQQNAKISVLRKQ
jgi:tetratricopeptide (TPR) repeat protein